MSFTKVGTISFDAKGECHDISTAVWWNTCKYPKDERTVVKDGDTYLYCITEVRGGWFPMIHFWAVYKGRAAEGMPDYLTTCKP